MSRTPTLAYLWPGVSQFWGRDVRSGLVVAVGFSILLNITLICTFIWTDLLGAWFRNAAWVVIFGTWVGWAILAYTWDRKYGATLASGVTDQLFEKAQKYYLESNWFEAERVLRKLLRQDRRDLDARFLLATLLRHSGRPQEARGELAQIERLDGAEKWALEIGRERDAIRRSTHKTGKTDTEESGSDRAGGQATAEDLAPRMEEDMDDQVKDNHKLSESAEKKLKKTDAAA